MVLVLPSLLVSSPPSLSSVLPSHFPHASFISCHISFCYSIIFFISIYPIFFSPLVIHYFYVLLSLSDRFPLLFFSFTSPLSRPYSQLCCPKVYSLWQLFVGPHRTSTVRSLMWADCSHLVLRVDLRAVVSSSSSFCSVQLSLFGSPACRTPQPPELFCSHSFFAWASFPSFVVMNQHSCNTPEGLCVITNVQSEPIRRDRYMDPNILIKIIKRA